jgi:hypothetical protein
MVVPTGVAVLLYRAIGSIGHLGHSGAPMNSDVAWALTVNTTSWQVLVIWELPPIPTSTNDHRCVAPNGSAARLQTATKAAGVGSFLHTHTPACESTCRTRKGFPPPRDVLYNRVIDR